VRVTILSDVPYSSVKVARDIYDVLRDSVNVELKLGYFKANDVGDKVIIVGTPFYHVSNLCSYIRGFRKDVEFIYYMVVEGDLNKYVRMFFDFLNDGVVLVPSYYVKEKFEDIGIRVAGVIHHGVRYFGGVKVKNDRVFGYLGGYHKRKYPDYGIDAVRKARILVGNFDFRVITSFNNPFVSVLKPVRVDEYSSRVTDDDVVNFYRSLNFYLNLSDAEGFGLTVLEALAFGNVVISPKLSVFQEFLPDFTLWVPLTGEKWYESFNLEYIEHHKYDSNEMVKRILEAYNMDDKVYGELSYKAVEHARKYDIKNIYSKFLEYL
jgi:hypothetical protein